MATITDFNDWMQMYVEDINDAFCVKDAIDNEYSCGGFDVKRNGDKLFVECYGDTLMLASEKAKETFLSMLEARYADEGLDIESTYEYYRQMSKDD